MQPVFFTQRVSIIPDYGERRDEIDQKVVTFLYICGFLPIPLPNKVELAKYYFEEFCPAGIVLTGGNSLQAYGGDAPERDAMERECIALSMKKNIPIYGFCRGMQSLLDYFGNQLVNISGHAGVRHSINLEGVKKVVNSYHNQGLYAVKSPLNVLGYSDDGVVEAIAYPGKKIFASMWHPERESPFDLSDIKRLQKLFIKSCE